MSEDHDEHDNVWLARLSLYVGTWVLMVVVSHDQPCSGETGSLNWKWVMGIGYRKVTGSLSKI